LQKALQPGIFALQFIHQQRKRSKNMTQEQNRKIIESIIECNKQIAREMEYSPKFRKEKNIAFYEQHKAKLQSMLVAK
jgi:FixJ family two-component response regulator